MNFLRIPVCCRRHLAHLDRFRTLQKQAASDIRAVPMISACHVRAAPEPATVSYEVPLLKGLDQVVGKSDWTTTLSIALCNASSLMPICQLPRFCMLNKLQAHAEESAPSASGAFTGFVLYRLANPIASIVGPHLKRCVRPHPAPGHISLDIYIRETLRSVGLSGEEGYRTSIVQIRARRVLAFPKACTG